MKVAPDFSNIFIGHATWWTYTSMLRVYKHYTFELQGEQYKTRTTSMSSYPGKRSREAAASASASACEVAAADLRSAAAGSGSAAAGSQLLSMFAVP